MNTEFVTDGFADLTTFVTGTAAPALLGLAVVGVVVRIAVRYIKRAGGAA